MDQTSWTTKLLSKKTIATDVFELHFTKPDGFDYKAGQFVQFQIPKDGTTVLRSYSISSTPSDTDLEFCVKLVPGGVGSTFFSGLDTRTTVTILGPRGRFIFEKEQTPLMCVATGAGMAPIMGIIADELENKKNTMPIHVLFGVRSETDVFWTERLEQLKNQYQHFTYHVTLSQPHDSWTGLHGRVTAHLENQNPQAHYFLCGNAEMVKEVREILIQQTIPSTAIHFEIF